MHPSKWPEWPVLDGAFWRNAGATARQWLLPLGLSGGLLASQGGWPVRAQAPAGPGLFTLDELAWLREQSFLTVNKQLQARGWRLARQKKDLRFGCLSYWWAYPLRQPGEPADSLFLAVYPGGGSWNALSHKSANRQEYALVRATVLARHLRRNDNPSIVRATDSASQCYNGPRQYIMLDYDGANVEQPYYLRLQHRDPKKERADSIALVRLKQESSLPVPEFETKSLRKRRR